MLPYIKTSGSLVRSEKASASTFKLHKQAPLGDRPSAVEAVTVFARAAGANVRDAEHCEDLTFQAWSSNFGASNLRPRRPYAANSSPSAEISFLPPAHTRESVRAPVDLCRVRLGLPGSGAVESVVKLSPKLGARRTHHHTSPRAIDPIARQLMHAHLDQWRTNALSLRTLLDWF
jgi:hypothetical protein